MLSYSLFKIHYYESIIDEETSYLVNPSFEELLTFQSRKKIDTLSFIARATKKKIYIWTAPPDTSRKDDGYTLIGLTPETNVDLVGTLALHGKHFRVERFSGLHWVRKSTDIEALSAVNTKLALSWTWLDAYVKASPKINSLTRIVQSRLKYLRSQIP